MPIPQLDLDDREFADLIEEMRAAIPRYAPDWTNFNPSDPGIMLLELFAWLTEAAVYRINRIPESSRVQFARLLGAAFHSAQPLLLRLHVTTLQNSASGSKPNVKQTDYRYLLPAGTTVTTSPYAGQAGLRFETLYDVSVDQRSPNTIAIARQASRATNEVLGQSDGASFQLFKLAHPAIVLPRGPIPIRPQVYVDDDPWIFQLDLGDSKPGDKHFSIKPWFNALVFGNRVGSCAPAIGSRITVVYRSTDSQENFEREEFESSGEATQQYRLRKPSLPLDLQTRSDLEPTVTVGKEEWVYRPNIFAMTTRGQEFTIDPWHNAVRFGNEKFGSIPPKDAQIAIAYHHTVRPASEASPGAPLYLVNTAESPVSAEEQPPEWAFTVLETMSTGSDVTTLDEAHWQSMDMLKSRWRTITVEDFEKVIQTEDLDIARVKCLPGRNVDSAMPAQHWPGHVSVAVAPEARHSLTACPSLLDRVLGASHDGHRIVAFGADGRARLWNAETGQCLCVLGGINGTTDIGFSSDGQRLLATGDCAVSSLWDTATGELLDDTFGESAKVNFAAQGARLISQSGPKGIRLHDARDGSVIALLAPPGVDSMVALSSDEHLAAVANSAGQIDLRELRNGAVIGALTPSFAGRIAAMTFAPDNRLLAAAVNIDKRPFTDDITTPSPAHELWLWRTDTGQRTGIIKSDAAVSRLSICPTNSRLVTFREPNRAALWSIKRRRLVADLSATADVRLTTCSSDGRWLAVAYGNDIVRLWDVGYGQVVADFSQEGAVEGLAFSPQNRVLVIRDECHTVQFWRLPTQGRDAALMLQISRDLAILDSNGRWCATIDDSLVEIWSVEEGKQDSAILLDLAVGAPVHFGQIAHGKYLFMTCANVGPPDSEEPNTTVQIWNAEHVFDVRALLEERNLVTCQSEVTGPQFTDLIVKAVVARGQPFKDQERLKREISEQALNKFLHPLHGGPEGTGWPWGRDVYASEIYQALEKLDGVDHVESLRLLSPAAEAEQPNGESNELVVHIPPFHLVRYRVSSEDIEIVEASPASALNVTFRVK